MNHPTQPLHIWIFNDASVSCLLNAKSPLWPDFTPGLLAELSSSPVLAHTLNLETPAGYPGLAGLLGSSTSPADLAVRLPDLSIPAILSPAQALSPATAFAAIRRLRVDPRIQGTRLLLLEASLVADYLPGLACVDQLGILWDMSSPPGAPVQNLLSGLEREILQLPGKWAGLLGYFSPDHHASAGEIEAAAESMKALPSARMIHL